MITRSNPKNPFGNFRDRKIAIAININNNTAKRSGSEMVPENANAETNGIVRM